MKKDYRYIEIFQRNIGIFNMRQIERIKEMDIAIAGVGGVGGHIAIAAARLGIEKIRIIDPDVFEVNNINRQQGATIDSVNKHKVKVIRAQILKINPKVKVYSTVGKINKLTARNFIKYSDVVFDGIDFFQPYEELSLHQACTDLKKIVITGQIAGSVVSIICYPPKSRNLFEKMFFVNGRFNLFGSIKKQFPILPANVSRKKINEYIQKKTIPSYALTSPFLASIMLEQAISVYIKKVKPVCLAPKVLAIDLQNLHIVVK